MPQDLRSLIIERMAHVFEQLNQYLVRNPTLKERVDSGSLSIGDAFDIWLQEEGPDSPESRRPVQDEEFLKRARENIEREEELLKQLILDFLGGSTKADEK